MTISPARRLAYEVVRRVELGYGFAADLLRQTGNSLSEPDQSLATELIMGSLRRRAELDFLIGQVSGRAVDSLDPEIVIILRLGIYQIRCLGRIPKRAAVNESVELTKLVRKRSAAGLVNAVLRKCEPMDSASGGIEDLSNRMALPPWLLQRWANRFGIDAANHLARLSLQESRTVIRITACQVQDIHEQLAADGIELRPAPYAPGALVVERGRITRSQLWRDGLIVIQEEASQLVGSLLKPLAGQSVLDLCAAPGVKMAQIAAELSEGLIVACDRNARRLAGMDAIVSRLVPAEIRWHRVQLDASSSLPFATKFDHVLVDAPCSGTGTLARNPEIKWRLTPGDIDRLAELQHRILGTALDALAPGGRLVYATCSLEPEENEEVVQAALTSAREVRMIGRSELVCERPELQPLIDELGFFRTRPDLHHTDGFCAAVIERER